MATSNSTAPRPTASTANVHHLRIVRTDSAHSPARVAARAFPALARQDVRAARLSLDDVRAKLLHDHGLEAMQRPDGSWFVAFAESLTEKGLRALLADAEFMSEVQADGKGNMRDRAGLGL